MDGVNWSGSPRSVPHPPVWMLSHRKAPTERLPVPLGGPVRFPPRPVHAAPQACLATCGILAGRFAKGGCIGGEIEKVIRQLESAPDHLTKASHTVTVLHWRASDDRTRFAGKAQKRTCFSWIAEERCPLHPAPAFPPAGRAPDHRHAADTTGAREFQHQLRLGRIGRLVSGAAMISKARVRRLSPARMAVASSNAICTVGLPRLRSSSSMAGRSSCTSE